LMTDYPARGRHVAESLQLGAPSPPNTPLMVTVLASAEADAVAADWSAIAGEALVRAYGDDEPDCTDADLPHERG
jgi:hypothetical protein